MRNVDLSLNECQEVYKYCVTFIIQYQCLCPTGLKRSYVIQQIWIEAGRKPDFMSLYHLIHLHNQAIKLLLFLLQIG